MNHKRKPTGAFLVGGLLMGLLGFVLLSTDYAGCGVGYLADLSSSGFSWMLPMTSSSDWLCMW